MRGGTGRHGLLQWAHSDSWLEQPRVRPLFILSCGEFSNITPSNTSTEKSFNRVLNYNTVIFSIFYTKIAICDQYDKWKWQQLHAGYWCSRFLKMDFCHGVTVWKIVILDQVQRSLNKNLEEIYLMEKGRDNVSFICYSHSPAQSQSSSAVYYSLTAM